jgi:hypothetical protein
MNATVAPQRVLIFQTALLTVSGHTLIIKLSLLLSTSEMLVDYGAPRTFLPFRSLARSPRTVPARQLFLSSDTSVCRDDVRCRRHKKLGEG